MSSYVADFDEVGPVHAASGDVAATTEDAQTMVAALGLVQAVLIFDSPAAADRQQADFKDAIDEAKKRLEEVGKGSDLVGDVERAKQAIDAVTPAAARLSGKLKSIVG